MDAYQIGLAFWSPDLNLGFAIKESDDQFGNIFFNESLAVVFAIEWAAHLPNHPHCILVHTDSMNTVDIWHLLTPQSDNIPLMLYAVEVMMDCNIDIRVVHIPGSEILVANALSQSLFDTTINHEPALQVSSFTPPQHQMRARQE